MVVASGIELSQDTKKGLWHTVPKCKARTLASDWLGFVETTLKDGGRLVSEKIGQQHVFFKRTVEIFVPKLNIDPMKTSTISEMQIAIQNKYLHIQWI